MLLLFWKAVGLLIGDLLDIKWVHDPGYPPMCLLNGELGVSIANPYLLYSSPLYDSPECSYALLDSPCVASDIYHNKLIVGTESAGLFVLDWPLIKSMSCPVEAPVNLSASVGTFTDFSGLLSQNIIAMEANGDGLGIVTDTGLSYGSFGSPVFVNYLTASGADCFVCMDGSVYFADGDQIRFKAEPTDFATWDYNYACGSDVADVWVTERDGVQTLFAATGSGITIFEQGASFSYGNDSYLFIKAEVGATINQGHVFAVTANRVDIINMRTKLLQESHHYTAQVLVGLENKRLYSK